MQTVDHSPFIAARTALQSPRRPDLHDMREVKVRPIVPRRRTLPTRESLQAAEDGGETEAHPS